MADQTTHVPTIMPTTNRPINNGASLDDDTSRLDGIAKVTGAAQYSRDKYLPNTLFAAFFRCPFGAAELESIDEAAAMKVDGVAEVKKERDNCTYHGQPGGYVVAESPLALKRGLKALNPQWKQQRFNRAIEDEVDAWPALKSSAEEVLGAADHVLEAVYTTQVADSRADRNAWRGDRPQGRHRHGVRLHAGARSARRMGWDDPIGLPRSKFEVNCEYVGGGFGSKLNGAGKEGITAARISKKYKRPCHFFVDRPGDQLDTGNRPSSRVYVRLGYKNNGAIVGGQIDSFGGVGVGGGGGGTRVPSGRYRMGEVELSHSDVSFNAGAPRPFRAPGCPQGAYVEELMLDEIATGAGVDPLELRLNLERSGDRKEMLELAAERIGWSGPHQYRRPTRRDPARLWTGHHVVGDAIPPAQRPRWSSTATVRSKSRTGTQDIGTGQRTMAAVVAADALNVPLKMVHVAIGRSSLPYGPIVGRIDDDAQHGAGDP